MLSQPSRLDYVGLGDMKRVIKFEPGKWYTAYHKDATIPFHMLYMGKTPRIEAWGMESFDAKITTFDGSEMLSVVIRRRKYIAFADRRLDVEYYIKTYGGLPQWLKEELEELKVEE